MRNPVNLVIGFLGILVAIVIVVFVLANESVVPVSFSPLPWEVNWPIWLVILGFFGVGALLGGLFVWANAHKSRRISVQRKRRIKALEKELAETQSQVTALEAKARKQVAEQRATARLEDQSAA